MRPRVPDEESKPSNSHALETCAGTVVSTRDVPASVRLDIGSAERDAAVEMK